MKKIVRSYSNVLLVIFSLCLFLRKVSVLVFINKVDCVQSSTAHSSNYLPTPGAGEIEITLKIE